MASILITAKQAGSVNALVEPARELERRGHSLTIYATGSELEAKGFEGLDYQRGQFDRNLLKGKDILLAGLSGHDTPDGEFIREARKLGIHSIGVNDQNTNYMYRFQDITGIPDLVGLMNESCLASIDKELPSEMAGIAKGRARVIGWTAFDSFATVRDEFTDEKRKDLLYSLVQQGLDVPERVLLHLTQNVNPPHDKDFYEYETKVTEMAFEAAKGLGKTLLVRPHPREQGNFTEELSRKFGFVFISPKACSTRDLILSSYSLTAGRSTALSEACLLDKDAGGVLPDIQDKDLAGYQAIMSKAIPYTQEWEDIGGILSQVYSEDDKVRHDLAKMRKNFSVDGKASKRLADLVEEVLKRQN